MNQEGKMCCWLFIHAAYLIWEEEGLEIMAMVERWS
jgi:hypothetical protein